MLLPISIISDDVVCGAIATRSDAIWFCVISELHQHTAMWCITSIQWHLLDALVRPITHDNMARCGGGLAHATRVMNLSHSYALLCNNTVILLSQGEVVTCGELQFRKGV